MLVFGTRPEAIKMCPLILELKKRPSIQTIVCVTAQHRQMLDQVLDTFGVVPDYDLNIMKPKQSLFDITVNVLNGIRSVIEQVKPDVVLYEEGLDDSVVNGALNAIMQADTLIIAGTSLTVYPAAGFIRYFRGGAVVLINRDKTPFDSQADLVFHDKVGELLDKIKVGNA